MSLMLDSIKDYAMFILDDRGAASSAWHDRRRARLRVYARDEMTDESAAPLFDATRGEFARAGSRKRATARPCASARAPAAGGRRPTFIGATIVRPLATSADGPSGLCRRDT